MATRDLLIGTYTSDRTAEGLYWCTLDDAGRIEPVHCLHLRDPSFVAVHPRLPMAYAVEETPEAPGGVVRIAIDRMNRHMSLLDRVSSEGHFPCHAALSHSARKLWVTNYGSGSVGVYRLDASGRIGGSAELLRHEGRSSHPRRQASPHPHGVAVHPNRRDVHVTDLGTDRIERYALGTGGAVVHEGGCALPAGAGPRHLCFDRAGRRAFVSTELDNTLTVLDVDDAGNLTPLTRSTTLPANFTGPSATSEVALHPNERFVYVANRGHDSLACFSIDPRGEVAPIAWVPSGGAHPRHFALSPAGERLVVANRDSDCLVTFIVDSASGTPHSPVESALPAPAFVCWVT